MLDDRRKRYLKAMGIQVFVRRPAVPDPGEGNVSVRPAGPGPDRVTDASAVATTKSPAAGSRPSDSAVPRDDGAVTAAFSSEKRNDWQELKREVAGCTACELHRTRTQTVLGVGNEQAALMVIGEAPGAEEDRQGEPFVGRAGHLLDAMLRAIGLQRGDVYIANVLKCRPPGNRNPAPAEAACCLPFLERQIALVAPRLILAVGGVAAHHLLGSDEPVGRLRGRIHEYGGSRIPLIASYHPAYLLRQPAEKAKAWQDLQKVRRILEGA